MLCVFGLGGHKVPQLELSQAALGCVVSFYMCPVDRICMFPFARNAIPVLKRGFRACLSKKNFDRKKYAVESKRAKNCIFDVVGSWHILKAFHRKEAVKCVKRASVLLVPLADEVGLHCCCSFHEVWATCSTDCAG